MSSKPTGGMGEGSSSCMVTTSWTTATRPAYKGKHRKAKATNRQKPKDRKGGGQEIKKTKEQRAKR